jgi:hypothetical protein
VAEGKFRQDFLPPQRFHSNTGIGERISDISRLVDT